MTYAAILAAHVCLRETHANLLAPNSLDGGELTIHVWL